MSARAESPHVQVDKADHNEGKSRRGEPGAPVMDPEILKQKHRSPVVESGLLQPGVAVEIGGNAGAETVRQILGDVEPVQHLVRDLGVAGLVSSHQSQTVAAQYGCEAVNEEERQ
jgi:hypothetical protein